MKMKIKGKNKAKSPIKKYDVGGQNWDNLATSPQNQNTQGIGQTQKTNISGSQIGGYAAGATEALSPLWQQSEYYKPETNVKAQAVGNSVKSVASMIPIAGSFVQAGSQLGEGFNTGMNKALAKKEEANSPQDKSKYQAGADAMAFLKGMSDPISNYVSIDKARKAGVISTGEAIGLGLTHWLGPGPGFSETFVQRKLAKHAKDQQMDQLKDSPNLQFNTKPTTESSITTTTPEDFMNYGGSLRSMSKYNNGGQLEQHNLPLHSQMADDWANAQLDGKPVQINAKETIFRKKNGGDYVFSDNKEMLNPKTGNTFAEDSKKIEKKTQKPYFDPASLNVKKYQLNELSKVNDVERSKIEKAEYGKRGTYGIDGDYELPSLTGTNGRIDAALNEELPVNYTNLQIPQTQLNIPAKSNLQFQKEKTPIQSNNNLTTGDWLQIAGQIPALAYNTAQAFKKPEQQKLYLDRTPITQQSIAKDYNPSFLALNAAYKGIDEGTTSDAVRRASKISALSGVVPKLQEYDLAVDNANQSLRQQYEDRISNQTRFNVGQRLTTDDINARNRAATRAFGATAASNLGQGLTTFGIAKNQGLTNTIQYSTL